MPTSIEKLMNRKKGEKKDNKPDPISNGKEKTKRMSTMGANFVDIDSLGLDKLGYLVMNANSDTVEEYRLVKRRLLKNIGDGLDSELSNVFLVTSAMQGDGKTFSSINLALSLAMEMEKTVLFIDADVLKSGASKTFGIESEKGFIDYLEDENSNFGDLVYKTNVKNLRILPSGTARMRSTELFSSEKMKKVCVELSQRYPDRIIIIDSPPILQTTESQALANAIENIVFVVSSGHTPTTAVRDALTLLDNGKNVNFLLNKVRETSSVKYYYGQESS